MTNGCGALAGVLGPTIVGLITKNHSLAEWRIVMWILFIVMSLTTLIYWIFASTERQSWDYPEKESE